MGHFPYECRANPKKVLKRSAAIQRSAKPLKRSPINKMGKHAKQWLLTRQTWIRNNPPPVEGKYWLCYLQIHPFCTRRLDLDHLTLDHVVSRSRDPSLRYKASNLKPACIYCNEMKGSRSIEEVRKLML